MYVSILLDILSFREDVFTHMAQVEMGVLTFPSFLYPAKWNPGTGIGKYF